MTNINSKKDADLLKKNILTTCNIKIKIKNYHKLYNKTSKIYISNHTNYLDPLIIYHCFNPGFLASSIIDKMNFVSNISKHVPLLVIDRGKNNNTVDKIKQYLDENGDLCLFPEGILTYHKILAQFRTGAFNANHPIQPLVIRYKPTIYAISYKEFVLKMLSQPKIQVEITLLDIEFPPFTKKKINNIRKKMAKEGNFAISRVSNKDIKD